MDFNEEDFKSAAEKIASFIVEYDSILKNCTVANPVKPGDLYNSLDAKLPDSGEKSIDRLIGKVRDEISPRMVHWSHPENTAWYPAVAPKIIALGSMLENTLSCVGFSWSSSPALTELEQKVMDWLVDIYGLPEHFKFSASGTGGGCFQGTAGEAVLNACLAARGRFLSRKDVDPRKLIAYCSDQAHCSCSRAAQISLMQVRKVETNDEGSMTGELLVKQIKSDVADGFYPAFVAVTLGTTGICAFDDLKSIVEVLEAHYPNVWIHVDAAYAGPMFALKEYKNLLSGIDKVDSFNTNLSKIGIGGFDSSPMWVKNRFDLTNNFVENPDYLRSHENEINDENVHQVNFRDWTLAFGRKFRAIRVWLAMEWFGVYGIKEHVRNHIKLATEFEDLILKNTQVFELIKPRSFGLVCFKFLTKHRLKNGNNKDHDDFVQRAKIQYGLIVTSAIWKDQTYLRASFNAFASNSNDVFNVFQKFVNLALSE
ncbi:unnamed protein product [Oikopleura dioica]|uniref:Aromatic-L-amino-acid decarboxylase n=1 Tax=Oikopleura dioica TaxID=34765 RepID=E4WQT5_OIKDI|nr:unnamed protein product [Oikopleura dioica]